MVQKVIRGRDSLTRAKEMTEKLGIGRPLLVAGDRLSAVFFDKTGMELPRFSGYQPNPEWADCAAGAEMYREGGCDGLISLGGGSAMDTAKGIKALLCAASAEDALAGRFEARTIPHLAIPSTAGTGSEATQTSVVYVGWTKHSLSHPSLRPEGVILDAALTDSLPLYHKKACALDALCQGIESFWAKASTEDSQVNAFLAITGVLDNLRAYLAGDGNAAAEMLEASYRSGCAIQVTRTTAAHAMSYQLTKRFHLAHGHACMLTLPALWERMLNDTDVLPVLMDLAQKMRLGSELMVPRFLQGILYDLEMEIPPMPDEQTLDELADAVDIERLSNHPAPLTREDVKDVYRRAFTPKCGAERQACLDIWRYYGQA